MSARDKLKILLLQAREQEDEARLEERRSFAERSGLAEESIIPYDLLQKTPTLGELGRYDALMVGGSGDYYVSKGNLPGFEAVMALLCDVVAVGLPLFASCFGFQLLVQALGGAIVYDEDSMEVGTYRLSLTQAGQEDELFRLLPINFAAQLGHKDRAARLPACTLNLASSEQVLYQALRVPGQPIWATQFHPELTYETNLARFLRYRAGYAAVLSTGEIDKIEDNFAPSPEANDLLRHFIDLVFA